MVIHVYILEFTRCIPALFIYPLSFSHFLQLPLLGLSWRTPTLCTILLKSTKTLVSPIFVLSKTRTINGLFLQNPLTVILI